MKRNPIERQMKDYYDSIRFRKIRPRFFYRTCDKCNNEYKKQTMYQCEYYDEMFENSVHYYDGCDECFSSLDEFKTYCEDNILIKKEQWSHNGKPCTPAQKKAMLSIENNEKRKITNLDAQKEKWLESCKAAMNKHVDTNVLQFISTVLYDKPANEDDTLYNIFSAGSQYYFAYLLLTVFNRGTICWIPITNQYVWLDGDINNLDTSVAYDINGVYTHYTQNDLVEWTVLPKDIQTLLKNNTNT